MTIFAALTVTSATCANGPPVPEPGDLIALVRTTVLAADQGNKTGDYEALAQLGTASFQKANPASVLNVRFAKLRATGIDLKNVATMVPQTARAPTLDVNGLLRILGYFEFPGQQVVYDLLYDYDERGPAWRLAAVSIEPRALPPQPELMQPQ